MMLFFVSVYSFVGVVVAMLMMGVYTSDVTFSRITGVVLSILSGVFWMPIMIIVLFVSILKSIEE